MENLRALGFLRVLADGDVLHLDELPPKRDLSKAKELLVVVDRLAISTPGDAPPRLGEALGTAFGEGEGVALVLHDGGRMRFTVFPTCSACDTPSVPLTPNLFSFNNPRGACEACNGFGAVLEYAESLIVPDPSLAISDGAIDPWTKPRYEGRRRALDKRARELGADVNAPWKKLKATVRRELLHGKSKAVTSGSSPSSRGSRRSATSSTSACSCGSTSWRRPVRRAAARGSTSMRAPCAWPTA